MDREFIIRIAIALLLIILKMEDNNIKLEILSASAYAHIKAAEEFGRLGLLERRDMCLSEYNIITEQLSKHKKAK